MWWRSSTEARIFCFRPIQHSQIEPVQSTRQSDGLHIHCLNCPPFICWQVMPTVCIIFCGPVPAAFTTSFARLMLRPTMMIVLKPRPTHSDVIVQLPCWQSKRAVKKDIICRLRRKKRPSTSSSRECVYMASSSKTLPRFISFVSPVVRFSWPQLFWLSRFYQWLQGFLSTTHRKTAVEAAKAVHTVYQLWKFDGFTGSVEQCALDLTKVTVYSTRLWTRLWMPALKEALGLCS